jgi:signal transduction histidine kinase
VLRRGITRMEFLIGDLLALSRIDAEPRAISQTSAIEQILKEELAPQVKSLNGILRIQLEPAAVRCSEGLLRQVLWNITDNAMKYRRTEVQLEIEVEGHIVGNSYQFRISDNGSGMSPEAARHAFEPFFRAEAVRATPGTGLGLSIVKRVIDVSGGTVSVASEAGKGTTFVVHLPLDTSSDKAA